MSTWSPNPSRRGDPGRSSVSKGRTINTAIELHDSKILSIVERDGVIVAELVAYIHQSQGQPGMDAGTGWNQNVRLTFSDATVLTNCESFPDTILDGTLALGDATFENGFPVPQSFTGPCCMRIELANNGQLVISGGEFSATLIGQPNFIENFQP